MNSAKLPPCQGAERHHHAADHKTKNTKYGNIMVTDFVDRALRGSFYACGIP